MKFDIKVMPFMFFFPIISNNNITNAQIYVELQMVIVICKEHIHF
jgi:hypothetical protein